MTWVAALFLWVHSVNASPAPRVTRVVLARPHGVAGEWRKLELETRQVKSKRTSTLTVWGLAERPGRRVVPKSLARAIEADVVRWSQKLARAPRALASIQCTRGIEIDRGARHLTSCLDRATPALQRDFLKWYDQTAAWLE